MSVLTYTPAMVASGSFSNNNKTEPLAMETLPLDIPASLLAAFENTRAAIPPSSPPQLSSSVSSVTSLDSNFDVLKSRRASQEFYFPHQSTFESAVPVIVRAKDVHLKDHPIIEGAYAEYEKLYNADSVMTKDGRPMVRLL
ncbi:hypothetical protein BGZ76_002763 [Entomortierella beljakovae]|nr:hypothetical protein BGZ76_002763 [Entomortierella beljakovae]